MLIIVFVI